MLMESVGKHFRVDTHMVSIDSLSLLHCIWGLNLEKLKDWSDLNSWESESSAGFFILLSELRAGMTQGWTQLELWTVVVPCGHSSHGFHERASSEGAAGEHVIQENKAETDLSTDDEFQSIFVWVFLDLQSGT